MAVMLTGMLALVSLLGSATRLNAGAREASVATVAAAAKMEQLRTIDWDPLGLLPSPGDTLAVDTPGYVDYLDLRGAPAPPAAAAYVCRWSVAPMPSAPAAVVIQVVVRRSSDGSGAARAVRLTTVKTARDP